MKAQGLSVSFVVVAALAILVLVLGVAFLMGAFGSQKRSAQIQQVKTQCNQWCSSIQALASQESTSNDVSGLKTDIGGSDTSSPLYKYCKTTFNVPGNSNAHCYDISPCTVTNVYGSSITIDSSGCSGAFK